MMEVKLPQSLFDQYISRHRSIKARTFWILLILSAPFIAVLADSNLEQIPPLSSWRGLIIPPLVISYVLLLSPGMERAGNRALQSFREIVLLDDEHLHHLIQNEGSIPAQKERIAILIGGVLGLISALGSTFLDHTWVSWYWILSNILMYALLSWTIYATIASTRVINTLLNQPLQIDPFDLTPFEPIGRQSLINALVFVGGISISLIFVVWDLSILRELGFWLIYIPLGFIPVFLFFLNMLPTHRVLSKAKEAELSKAKNHFQQACRHLIELRENGVDTGNLPAEINALAAYQTQLQTTRTWPYNTSMLRTLFFSVLIPIGTLIGRIIIETLNQ